MATRPTKNNLRSIAEVAQTFRWHISFVRNPSAVKVPPNFNLQMTSTEVPKTDAGQSIEIGIRGHTIKRPGIYDDTHNITLNAVETIDNQWSEFLRTWRNAVWSRDTGVQQNISDCTGDLLLTRLDNLDNPIWQYTLFGCYLEDYDPTGGELGSDSEALRPTLTLYYDTFNDGPSR